MYKGVCLHHSNEQKSANKSLVQHPLCQSNVDLIYSKQTLQGLKLMEKVNNYVIAFYVAILIELCSKNKANT